LSFDLKRPENSESQISFEITGKVKMQMKSLKVKGVKFVRQWNCVMNQQLKVIPGFQRLNQRMFIECDRSVEMIRIRDFNCCQSFKEPRFSSRNPFP
jgi:hypothetical protein